MAEQESEPSQPGLGPTFLTLGAGSRSSSSRSPQREIQGGALAGVGQGEDGKVGRC